LNNKLVLLPESFASLIVGGSLLLDGNKLESLPESFGTLITVGGRLCLSENPLAESLNENFPRLALMLGDSDDN